ncbi:MAG: class I SAM-dependent methyltransferase [Clostridium sp.]
MSDKGFWNNIYKNVKTSPIQYDNWLDDYEELIRKNLKGLVIVDLGCGSGGNTKHFIEQGYEVIACDYSEEALRIVEEHIPKARVMNVDISKRLPFEDDFTTIVIGDLSLHYFDEKKTFEILDELKRVLKKDGYLFFRVNAVGDVNYGYNMGEELERNYFMTVEGTKRFFYFEEVNRFFKGFELVECKGVSIEKYGMKKEGIVGVVRNNK